MITLTNLTPKLMEISCPYCRSENLHKNGFTIRKSVSNAAPTDDISSPADTTGSNKITCLQCGNVFYSGDKFRTRWQRTFRSLQTALTPGRTQKRKVNTWSYKIVKLTVLLILGAVVLFCMIVLTTVIIDLLHEE